MGIVTYLLVLTLSVNVLCNPDPKGVDCRKFVFAPLCRGVAAKRTIPIRSAIRNGIIVDASKLKDLLKGYHIGAEEMGEASVLTAEAIPSGSGRSFRSHDAELPVPPFYEYDHNK